MRSRSKNKVFMQFFISYFVLFILPVLIVSLLTYTYMTRMIEREAERANLLAMTHSANAIDEVLQAIQEQSFQLLDSPLVRSLIRMSGEGQLSDHPERVAVIKDLARQLNHTFGAKPYIGQAYFYFPDAGGVIDAGGYYDSGYFFEHRNVFADLDQSEVTALFSDRKLMSFSGLQQIQQRDAFLRTVQASDRYQTIMTSFPFHARSPDVYLAVAIQEDKFKQLIAIDNPSIQDTLIVDEAGQVIIHAGDSRLDTIPLPTAAAGSDRGSELIELNQRSAQLNHTRSDFNRWHYLSLVDLETLREPAKRVSRMFVLLTALFTAAGLVIAYGFSRRMYRPIREIRQGFERIRHHRYYRHFRDEESGSGDEYDLIKNWSTALITSQASMHQQLENMRPTIQEHFLGKVLAGECKDELALRFYGEEVGLDLPLEGEKTVLLLDMRYLYQSERQLSETDKSFQLIEVKSLFHREAEDAVWQAQLRPGQLAVIVSGGTDAAVPLARRLLGYLEAYRDSFQSTIAVGTSVPHATELYRSCRHAEQSIAQRAFSRANELVCLSEREVGIEPHMECCLTAGEVHILTNTLQAGDKEVALRYIDSLITGLMSRQATAGQAHVWSLDLLHTLIRVAAPGHAVDDRLERYMTWHDRLQHCMEPGEWRSLFAEVCELLMLPPVREDRQPMFQEVLDDIHAHYAEELTLERYAERYGMSLGYFSRSFKDAVGEKYIDYVSKYRVSIAKELLIRTDKTVEAISEEVGYIGRNSFINLFKKYEGVTPGKYRAMHKRSEAISPQEQATT